MARAHRLDGAALALLPQRTADGRLLLQVRGFVQLLSEDRSFDPKGPALSPVHLPQYDRLLIIQYSSEDEIIAALEN